MSPGRVRRRPVVTRAVRTAGSARFGGTDVNPDRHRRGFRVLVAGAIATALALSGPLAGSARAAGNASSAAEFIENAVVLPAERPPETSMAKVSVTVWPAGTFKLMPEKSRTPWFNELYW